MLLGHKTIIQKIFLASYFAYLIHYKGEEKTLRDKINLKCLFMRSKETVKTPSDLVPIVLYFLIESTALPSLVDNHVN